MDDVQQTLLNFGVAGERASIEIRRQEATMSVQVSARFNSFAQTRVLLTVSVDAKLVSEVNLTP